MIAVAASKTSNSTPPPLILAAVLAASLVAGCAAGGPGQLGGASEQTFTTAAAADYLRRQNLPALECVEPWQNPDYPSALKLLTRHYCVYTTLLDPLMLRRLAGFLESAHRQYNRQLPVAVETDIRFTVYLFADRPQWEKFTRSFAGSAACAYLKIKAGAYYLNGSVVAYNIGRQATFSVLGHEGWHQFNHRHFKFRLPSWLDEGIATLFETYRYDNGQFYFEPGRNLYRLAQLKKTLAANRMIPLRKLISLNPGEVLGDHGDKATAAFYSQSYALVRFLREDNYGQRLADYHRLLLGGLDGKWPLPPPAARIAADRNIPVTAHWNRTVSPLLFEYYITADLDQLQQQYLAFCRKIVYRVQLK